MSFLPYSVWDFVIKNIIGVRHPAFMLLDDKLCLEKSGGNLKRYGFSKLKTGQNLEEILFFLDGLFPPEPDPNDEPEPFFLNCVQIGEETSADLFGFPTYEGYWLLFLDATEAKEQRLELQQRAYDLELSQGKLMKLYKDKETRLTELEKKKNMIDELVHSLFHDLRSPLVNIQGYNHELTYSLTEIKNTMSEMEMEGNTRDRLHSLIDEDIGQAQHYISSSIQKMDSVLKSLINLSKIGNLAPKLLAVDMNELVTEVKSYFNPVLKENNIEFELKELPNCKGNKDLLRQAFTYLLDNSIKYLKPDRIGNIIISGGVVSDRAIYCIEDNGVGIPTDQLNKVYEIFFQLDPDHRPGDGLGLSFVKTILGKLSGKIWIESEVDGWTKVFISLPA